MTKLRVLRGVVDPVLSRWALNASHTHPCKTEAETDTERKMDKTGRDRSDVVTTQRISEPPEGRRGKERISPWSTWVGGGGHGGRESIALPDFGSLALRTVK